MSKTIKTVSESKTIKTIKTASKVVKVVTESKTVKTARKGPAIGMVVYRGPSRIDGKPIVGIVTFKTDNEKTGNMAQLWILRSDINPMEASQTGEDESICGSCPLKGIARKLEGRERIKSLEKGGTGMTAAGRACYVVLHTAPLQIWTSYHAGSYGEATDEGLRRGIAGRAIRFGAYGDPAALPIDVLERLARLSSGHTGYTHQWENVGKGYSGLLMASVESESGMQAAHEAGWRTFRVRRDSDPIAKGEVACPASPEGGMRKQCATCKACDGVSRAGQSSIVIIGHGGLAATTNVNRLVGSLADQLNRN